MTRKLSQLFSPLWRIRFVVGWLLARWRGVLLVLFPALFIAIVFLPREQLATLAARTEVVQVRLLEPTVVRLPEMRLLMSASSSLTNVELQLEAGVAITAQRVADGRLFLYLRRAAKDGRPIGIIERGGNDQSMILNGDTSISAGVSTSTGEPRNVVIAFTGYVDIGEDVAPKVRLMLLEGTIRIAERLPLSGERHLALSAELDSGDHIAYRPNSDGTPPIARGFIYAGSEDAMRVTAHAISKGVQVSRLGSQGYAVAVGPTVWNRIGSDPVVSAAAFILILLEVVTSLLARQHRS